jgi:hypothetical protein
MTPLSTGFRIFFSLNTNILLLGFCIPCRPGLQTAGWRTFRSMRERYGTFTWNSQLWKIGLVSFFLALRDFSLVWFHNKCQFGWLTFTFILVLNRLLALLFKEMALFGGYKLLKYYSGYNCLLLLFCSTSFVMTPLFHGTASNSVRCTRTCFYD